MTIVVPTLLENLADLGRELPWPTRVLKAVSDSLLSNGVWIVAVLVLGVLGVGAFMRTLVGRQWLDELIFRTPLIGALSRKQEISRISLVIATLIGSGLDLLRALEVTSRTTRNTILQDSIRVITERIRSGRELGDAMVHLRYFPPLVSQVFAVGQKSGRLEEMLHQLSQDYDKQVATLSNRLGLAI